MFKIISANCRIFVQIFYKSPSITNIHQIKARILAGKTGNTQSRSYSFFSQSVSIQTLIFFSKVNIFYQSQLKLNAFMFDCLFGQGIYFVLLAEDNILVLLGDINILHFLRSSVFRGLFSGSLVLYKAQT